MGVVNQSAFVWFRDPIFEVDDARILTSWEWQDCPVRGPMIVDL